MKYFIETYGCQMNVHDSERMAGLLEQSGYDPAESDLDADIVVVNTCSVRERAEEKLYTRLGEIKEMSRENGRDPLVVVAGCVAQQEGEKLIRRSKGVVDLVVGTQQVKMLPMLVQKTAAERPPLNEQWLASGRPWRTEGRIAIENPYEDPSFPLGIVRRGDPVRAYVTIIEGCNDFCAFCVVPYTRGHERMRSKAEILADVRDAADSGRREVQLLGQIVNHYQAPDNPSCDFPALLEAVHEVPGIQRIRFTSPHPIGYKKDLIEAFTYLPKLAEHVHLPVQSGSDAILKRMHRPYTTAKFSELVKRIREARPDIAVTTDVIVGFPGETEGHYLETRNLFEDIRFDNAFVFRYSKRRGTPAAEMEEATQVPERIKEERNQDLLALVNSIALPMYDALVGQEVEILCEGPSKTNEARLTGRTGSNRIVVFEGNRDRHVGEIFKVRVNEAANFTLFGNPV